MQLDMFNMFRFQRSVWVWSATSLGVSAKRNIIQIYLLIRVGKVQWRWAVQYAWSHHEKAPAIYVQWEKSKSIPVSGVPLREFGLWRIWRLRFTNCWLPTPQLLPHLLSTIHWGRWPGLCWGLCSWFGDGILHLVAAQLCCPGWTYVPGIFNGSWLGMSFWVRCGFVWTLLVKETHVLSWKHFEIFEDFEGCHPVRWSPTLSRLAYSHI